MSPRVSVAETPLVTCLDKFIDNSESSNYKNTIGLFDLNNSDTL